MNGIRRDRTDKKEGGRFILDAFECVVYKKCDLGLAASEIPRR